MTEKVRDSTKHIRFNNYLTRELNKNVGFDKDFTTFSDIVVHACTRLVIELKYENENETAMSALLKILETPEGKEIFDKVVANKNERSSKKQSAVMIENIYVEDEDTEF
jgi:hypothetical protein